MLKRPDYAQARDLLLRAVSPVGTERVPLPRCAWRVLGQALTARENVPSFDRSPYDGYAFRAADSLSAAKDSPVTLRILEEIPAGTVPTKAVTAGTAAKILTGAPIPDGADAVIMYEKTAFTKDHVTLFGPAAPGDNIIRAGEDMRKGAALAQRGDVIGPGLAGALAAQGEAEPLVYKTPRVAVLSTGSELVEAEAEPPEGMIRNANRYLLEAALAAIGCETVYLGIAGDTPEEICAKLKEGLAACDAVVSTGGVSAGDYDLTPDAMEQAGAELLFRGVDMKPGMSCAYGIRDGKLICALSGNPASALTNFYAVALPALKRLTGRRDCMPREIRAALASDFEKESPVTRFLRGRLCLRDGIARMEIAEVQGNAALSSAIGCDMMAMIPAGSGPVSAGTVLKGFLL